MRRTGALAAGLLLASGIAASSAPASADTGVCQAAGAVITLTHGLYYPILGPTQTDVGLGFSSGGCTVTATLDYASCGNSFGTGTLTSASGANHDIVIQTAGGTVIVSGGAAGSANATPAPGESCVYPGPGADQFVITGAVSH